MKYCKEYLALFLLVVAVVIVGPLIEAIHDFSAITGGEKKATKEGFGSEDRIPSGEYPREVDEPLLYPTYQKKGAGYGVVLRENNSENNSSLYPVAANVSNYDQATNNVRDWVTPDNGSCMPAGMCGALYAPKAPEEYKVPEPLPLNSSERRVGFYGAVKRG